MLGEYLQNCLDERGWEWAIRVDRQRTLISIAIPSINPSVTIRTKLLEPSIDCAGFIDLFESYVAALKYFARIEPVNPVMMGRKSDMSR